MATASESVTVEHTHLLAALRQLRQVIARRNTIPILEHVRIEAGDESAELTATDLDRRLRIFIPVAAGAGTIKTAVHGSHLADYVAALPAGAQIRLTERPASRKSGAGKLEVAAGRSRAQIATMPATDFPAFAVPKTGIAPVDAAVLRRLLTLPSAVANTEETRYYLCGVHLAATADGRLGATATDGHQLLHTSAEMPDKLAKNDALKTGVIVPTASAKVIAGMLADLPEGETADISIGSNAVTVIVERPAPEGQEGAEVQIYFDTKLIDGAFPDWTRVVPQLLDAPAPEVDRTTFVEACRRAALSSDDKSRGAHIVQDGDDLVITGRGLVAATEERIAVQGALATEFGVNAKLLDSVLHMATGTGLAIHHREAEAPIRLVDLDDPDTTRVLMPLRMNRAELED